MRERDPKKQRIDAQDSDYQYIGGNSITISSRDFLVSDQLVPILSDHEISHIQMQHNAAELIALPLLEFLITNESVVSIQTADFQLPAFERGQSYYGGFATTKTHWKKSPIEIPAVWQAIQLCLYINQQIAEIKRGVAREIFIYDNRYFKCHRIIELLSQSRGVSKVSILSPRYYDNHMQVTNLRDQIKEALNNERIWPESHEHQYGSAMRLISFLVKLSAEQSARNSLNVSLFTSLSAQDCRYLLTRVLNSGKRFHFTVNEDVSESNVFNLMLDGLLAENTITIDHFSLFQARFSDDQFAKILLLIRKYQPGEVNIEGNVLDDDKLALLSELISDNVAIIKLELRRNSFQNAGLIAFSDALAKNNTLRLVDLSQNRFNTVATTKLAEALKHNCYLMELVLSQTCINQNSVDDFVKTFNNNQSLTRLQLDPCPSRGYARNYAGQHTEKFLKKNKQNSDELVLRVREGKRSAVKNLLHANVSPHALDEGNSLLHLAVDSPEPDPKLVTFLIRSGVHKGLRNSQGLLAIEIASQKGLNDIVEILNDESLQAADPSKKTIAGFFSQQPPKRAKAAVAPQALPNIATPLSADVINPRFGRFYFAAINGELETVQQCIVQEHIDVNTPCADGNTALHAAVIAGQLEVVQLLLEHGALPHAVNHLQQTTLHCLANIKSAQHSVQICTLLCETGQVNVDARDLFGLTALYYLTGGFDAGVVILSDETRALMAKTLLAHGASPNQIVHDLQLQRENCTPLLKAASRGYYDVSKVLLQAADCDMNWQDQNGWSALHYAVYFGHLVLIDRLLIEPKLNAKLLDNQRRSPMQLLEQNELHPNLVEREQFRQQAQQLIQQRLQRQLPQHLGVHWAKQLKVVYGAKLGSDKSLTLDLTDTHAYLKNTVRKKEDNLGNSAAARLVFVVSDRAHQKGGAHKRIAIPIDLTFALKVHVSNVWSSFRMVESSSDDFEIPRKRSPDALARIRKRHQDAPDEVKKACKDAISVRHPLSEDAILNLFQNPEVQGQSFEQFFHHSEHGLFDHLSQPEIVNKVVTKLREHESFLPGCKVYGMILNIYSKFYLCYNCEISTLGFLNPSQSEFVDSLLTQLTALGTQLPRKSLFRTITLYSSSVPCKGQSKKKEQDHQDLFVDWRGVSQGVILEQNEAEMQGQGTLYTSRK